ncbi:LOW QUALITY PROTEIN: hypothetical protein RJ641_034519 [Dillenia turbinata]|uniref:Uncharacterized protein n=1 Tax=Dillenia turbinata TaxID=194707 RepID=A0AAN8ZBM5_9MAGN
MISSAQDHLSCSIQALIPVEECLQDNRSSATDNFQGHHHSHLLQQDFLNPKAAQLETVLILTSLPNFAAIMIEKSQNSRFDDLQNSISVHERDFSVSYPCNCPVSYFLVPYSQHNHEDPIDTLLLEETRKAPSLKYLLIAKPCTRHQMNPIKAKSYNPSKIPTFLQFKSNLWYVPKIICQKDIHFKEVIQILPSSKTLASQGCRVHNDRRQSTTNMFTLLGSILSNTGLHGCEDSQFWEWNRLHQNSKPHPQAVKIVSSETRNTQEKAFFLFPNGYVL